MSDQERRELLYEWVRRDCFWMSAASIVISAIAIIVSLN